MWHKDWFKGKRKILKVSENRVKLRNFRFLVHKNSRKFPGTQNYSREFSGMRFFGNSRPGNSRESTLTSSLDGSFESFVIGSILSSSTLKNYEKLKYEAKTNFLKKSLKHEWLLLHQHLHKKWKFVTSSSCLPFNFRTPSDQGLRLIMD